jgi:tetratricopeptide (TPR) repeat protein
MYSAVSRFSLLVLLFLCAAASAHASGVWLRVETANFEVVGDATEAEIKGVAERLERFREAMSKIIAVRPNAVRTRVLVFKDDASFRPFKPKRADGTPDDLIAGLFQPGEDVNYIAIAAGGADLSTIYHEYTHDVMNASFGRTEIPAWLNEGLAEYFQTFKNVDERTAELGSAPRTHLNLLTRGPLIPWDEFFAVDSFSLQERGAHSRTLFYAQAWALVHHLIETAQAGGAIDPKELQGRAKGLDRPKLEADIRAMIASVTEPRSIAVVNPATQRFTSAPISDARANAYLGDLLYHLKDYPGAEKYIGLALAVEPKMPAANATLGMVRLRQRKFPEAKRHLEAAVAGDADNFLVHFYYAYLLTRENMNEAGLVSSFPVETAKRIRESLRRSIRLNEGFTESYRLLGLAALVTNEALEEALAGVKKAESLRPGDTEIALMVPQILLRQENADEAWKAADRIARSTSNPRARKEAESVMAAATQLTAERSRGSQLAVVGRRQPIIYQRKDLTDEQFEKLERDRVINNVNGLIERPRKGERQAVGTLGRVVCTNERIVYNFKKADGGALKLTGRRFDDLRLKVFIEGTLSFAFRCDSTVTYELAVITYRPTAHPGIGGDGELLTIEFVPGDFELRTLEQVANAPQIIVQGGPTTRLDDNAKSSAAERAEMERVMRTTQVNDIEERLRPAGTGERRVLVTPERLECSAGKMILTAKGVGGPEMFHAPIAGGFEAVSYNPDAGIVEVGCRAQLPSLPAVITYRQKGNDRELVAVEFVPSFYKLPRE